MGGNRLVEGNEFLTVVIREFSSHVTVERLVEGAHLIPQPIHFQGKLIRSHVISGPPESTKIFKTELPGSFIGQFHKALVLFLYGP